MDCIKSLGDRIVSGDKTIRDAAVATADKCAVKLVQLDSKKKMEFGMGARIRTNKTEIAKSKLASARG